MTDVNASIKLDAATIGPIDVLALEFPGNNFNGSILRNLQELVAAGTIRIIDLVVVMKNQMGSVSVLELHELSAENRSVLAPLHISVSQMISREDINAIGAQLATNTTAAILITENTWAIKTMQAMLDANGRVLVFERIPHEIVQGSLEDLAADEAAAA